MVFHLTTHVDAKRVNRTTSHADGTQQKARTSAGYMGVPHHKWWLKRANASRLPQT